jgi:hypothetical protein
MGPLSTIPKGRQSRGSVDHEHLSIKLKVSAVYMTGPPDYDLHQQMLKDKE